MTREGRSGGGGWWRISLLALIVFAVGVAVGTFVLGRNGEEPRAWRTADELDQMYGAPDGFNVVESNKAYEVQLMSLLHDQLYHYDPARDRMEPGLAKSHEVSSDGKTWTFHLRPAETADGVRLSADDVVFSVNLCLDPRFNCKRRGNLMIGGQPVVARAVDPLTVVFTLPEVYSSFPWGVSEVLIVPKAVYEPIAASPEAFRRAVGVQQPELKYLAGFGPYRVAALDTQEIRLERNDHFWGRGDDQDPRPHLKQIVLSLRKAGSTLELDFRHNDRYPYRLVGSGEAERLREDPNFLVLDRGRSGWCTFFWLNQNPRAPWAKEYPDRLALVQKVEFRRAVAHALDRDEIIRRVFKGNADVLYGPVSPIFQWAAPSETLHDQTPALDRQAALDELAALGVTPAEAAEDGKHWLTYAEGGRRLPLVFEIRTSQSEEDVRKKTAEVVAEQLGRIGLKVKVVEESFRDVVKRLDETYDYEASVMALEGSPNAATMRTFFESSGQMHFPNPSQEAPAMAWEADVDRQFKTFAASLDPVVQQTALVELQKTWVQAQPAFHLYNDRKLVAVRRDYEVNGMALTGRADDPLLTRTVIENVRLRKLAGH
jgi:peptide/nickel transport system substrate-binding protein